MAVIYRLMDLARYLMCYGVRVDMMKKTGRAGLLLVIMLLTACAGGSDQETAELTVTAAPAASAAIATEGPVEPAAAPIDAESKAAETQVVGEALDATGLAPESVAGEIYYAPFPVSIELDGDLGDWEGVPRVTIPELSPAVQGETSLTFAAAADDEYLYLLGDVTDARIISGEHGENYWNEDSLEFYINGTGDLSLTSYRDGVAQITVPALNMGLDPEEAILAGVQGETAEAQVVTVETDGGYTVEMAVPLKNSVWNIQREHGNVIGFQVHLNSASDANRNLKAIWSTLDKADSSYQDPSVFGQLLFFEIGETAVTANVPQPTPGPTREAVEVDAAYLQADLPVAIRVEDLMARMSLADKIGQMTLVEKNSINPDDIRDMAIGGLLSGGGGYPDENTAQDWAEMVDGFQAHALDSYLGIPLIYGVDAVHGHNNVRGATIFPHNIGLGAANNPELMEAIGRVTAEEMIATGIYWNYAPAVMVPQDVRWGRTYEGYAENTELVSSLASAYLRGLQGENLADPDTVLATPKHYVGDGGTAWGSSTTGSYMLDQGVADVDEETLRAVHLPPYASVIDAGAASIMISFSSWGGEKMHAQQYLIEDVLKDELGFEGFIVSDWGGIDQIDNDYYTSVVKSINAGVDMNMVPYNYRRFIDTLTEAVEAGDVPMERIDDAVRQILKVKFELGLFEHPTSDPALLESVGSDAHRAVAREAVAQSMVLLKDEKDLLPLSKDSPFLFVGGVAADDIGIQSGGWTIEWQGAKGDITPGTTILQAIENTVSPDTLIVTDEYGRFDYAPAFVPIACVGVVGEEPYAEGVGDSAQLRLPVNDIRALARMRERCDELIVILLSGRPVIINDLIGDWDALIAAWLPGTEGQGVADVLFGEAPFVGKLPYTWPRTVQQLPFDYEALPLEGCEGPLFPFGYGLTEEMTTPVEFLDCAE